MPGTQGRPIYCPGLVRHTVPQQGPEQRQRPKCHERCALKLLQAQRHEGGDERASQAREAALGLEGQQGPQATKQGDLLEGHLLLLRILVSRPCPGPVKVDPWTGLGDLVGLGFETHRS